MHAEFWHQRWANQQIGFHLDHVNPHLLHHFPCLHLAPGSRIVLPLCGKTLDIHWLLAQGYAVTGIELSEIAVQALFDALQLTPEISQHGALKHYQAARLQAGRLDLWQGDFFSLTADQLGKVDAVYDRAALVALPEPMRVDYAQHLMQITGKAPQLLISFDYDQSQHAGPPFCVNAAEIRAHYEGSYQLTLLADVAVNGGLKGQCPAQEQVWHLQTR